MNLVAPNNPKKEIASQNPRKRFLIEIYNFIYIKYI